MRLRKSIIIICLLLIVSVMPLRSAEIHKAAKDGDFEKVKQLLDKDPQLLNSGNQLGQTPLLMASYGGYKDIVLYLLEKGAAVNQPDVFGATPLHMAVTGGRKEIVELLISKGANVNAKSKNGRIPLQLAFERDEPGMVEIFIKHGLQVDATINSYGRTLLHEAVIMGKPKVVSFLLEKGAAPETRDKTGKTPLDLAMIIGNKQVSGLLMEKGAKAPASPPLEITYIANAGFLINVGEQKVLLDTLFRGGMGKYQAPSDSTLDDIIKAKPPFDKVRLLLVTFNQEVHFDAGLTENFLEANPQAVLLSGRQVGLDLELNSAQYSKIRDRVTAITPSPNSLADVILGGNKMKILRLNIGGEYQALGFIMNLEGRVLCCLGDALIKNNEEILKALELNREGIEVLFIAYWDFMKPETRVFIDQHIQPKKIAVMHIPLDEREKVVSELEKLGKEYPQMVIFKDFMQRLVL